MHNLQDPLYLNLRPNASERETKLLRNGMAFKQRMAEQLISSKGEYSPDASMVVWLEMSLKDMNDENE